MAEPQEIVLRADISHHEEWDMPGISLICKRCEKEIAFVNTPTGLSTLNYLVKTYEHRCADRKERRARRG